jgi:hypothetical protein
VRAKTGAVIKRAALIQALVDALAESTIDLTTATGEAEVKALRAARIGG